MNVKIARAISTVILSLMTVTFGFGFAPPDAAVFINEIHYDNAGTDAGELVEIAGPAGTDLTGWTLWLYNGSGGAVYGSTALSGVIPGRQNGYGALAFSYPSNGIQNGSPDGMALTAPGGTLVLFLSYEGSFTAAGGPADGQTATDIGVAEPSDTPVGSSLQLTGNGTSYGAFSWSGPAAASPGLPNAGQTFAGAVNAPVLVSCGEPLTSYQSMGAERAVTASDADGTVVGISLTVDPVPAVGGIALDGFTPAAETGGTAAAVVSVHPATPPGQYTVTITASNSDDSPQTGTADLGVTVMEILPIGAVQGAVGDADDGLASSSPYAGSYVAVKGVIYQTIVTRTSSGSSNYGFFLQNAAADADADPNTSDGIFVYMGKYTTLIGGYAPLAGDEVIIRGRVSEYYGLTELSSASALSVARTGVDLESEVPAFEACPPEVLADAYRYWERREGMRARVPGGSIVLSGRSVFASTMDGEVWVAPHSSRIAMRWNPYARRAFRDAHPLDDDPWRLFDNGNGYRIVMGSLGLKAAAGDNSALIAPARVFDVMMNSPVGGVYFAYEKYQIQVGEQPDLARGADPSLNSPPWPFDRRGSFSAVSYNLENLYDYRDDPFDDCDFPGDPGTPDVKPPFDYVPSSNEAYQVRLGQIAAQIIGDLRSPDILMVQEVEDQDIASVVDGALVYGGVDDADGRPDVLQELAIAISAAGGPSYQAAYDRDGSDDRGISCAFLYRTDRVELLAADPADPVLGSAPRVSYRAAGLPMNAEVQNPKALNAELPDDVDTGTGVDGDNVFTRAPEAGLFRVWRDGIGASTFTDLYLVSVHFSSGPDSRVGQRAEQAAYCAAIAAAVSGADPKTRVIVAGDFNVYPRPDDPFAADPSDQLAALYEAGMTNLWDRVAFEAPAAAYGYVYDGQAQTLDQMFVNGPMLAELLQFRPAHINSDWPSDFPDDGPRGTSDHDPQVGAYSLVPTLEGVKALVFWLSKAGGIRDDGTVDILTGFLERARRFRKRGMFQAAEMQIRAFIFFVRMGSPRDLTPEAADALLKEAGHLLPHAWAWPYTPLWGVFTDRQPEAGE